MPQLASEVPLVFVGNSHSRRPVAVCLSMSCIPAESEAATAAAARTRLVHMLLDLDPRSIREVEEAITAWRDGNPSSDVEDYSFELVPEEEAAPAARASAATPAFAPPAVTLTPAAPLEHAPPPLMLNALCGIAALVGLLWGGPLLGQSTALPSTLETGATDVVDAVSVRAGGELGLLKFCGTTANLCGSP